MLRDLDVSPETATVSDISRSFIGQKGSSASDPDVKEKISELGSSASDPDVKEKISELEVQSNTASFVFTLQR